MEKAFREKKCISSKFELARFYQGTDDMMVIVVVVTIVVVVMMVLVGFFLFHTFTGI